MNCVENAIHERSGLFGENFFANFHRLIQDDFGGVSLRTKSREFAMPMLFQWDMSQQISPS